MAPSTPRNKNCSKKQLHLCLEISCFTLILLSIFSFFVILSFSFDEDDDEISKANDFEKPFCRPINPKLSIDITNAKQDRKGNYKTEDGLVFTPDILWTLDDSIFGCPCSVKPCIPKCCPIGQEYDHSSSDHSAINKICVATNKTLFKPLKRDVYKTVDSLKSLQELEKVTVSDEHFYIFLKEVCSFGTKTLNASRDKLVANILMDDGRIILTGILPHLLLYDQLEYCLESFKGSNELFTHICRHDHSHSQNNTSDFSYNTYDNMVWVLMATEVLILCTFLIYSCFPQLRNLQGKSLMCYMGCLFLNYGALIATMLRYFDVDEIEYELFIKTLELVWQFTFLSTFFWLNVMCIDIWWVFSNPITSRAGEVEKNRFLSFSVYAWGCPVVVIFFAKVTDFSEDIGYKTVLFWFLPFVLLNSLNLMMFLSTLIRLVALHKEAEMLGSCGGQRHYKAKKGRFNVYLKLAVVMGISWLVNTITFFFESSMWDIFNIINALQGFAIFMVFACKKRTLKLIKQRFCPGLQVGDWSRTPSCMSSTRVNHQTSSSTPRSTQV